MTITLDEFGLPPEGVWVKPSTRLYWDDNRKVVTFYVWRIEDKKIERRPETFVLNSKDPDEIQKEINFYLNSFAEELGDFCEWKM